MIMKQLKIYCSECNYVYETDDSSTDFDEALEVDECPCCLKFCAEAL